MSFFVACHGTTTPARQKVGLVLDSNGASPFQNNNYYQAMYNGLTRAGTDFNLDVDYLSVPVGDLNNATQKIEDFAQLGYQYIIVGSYYMADNMVQAASVFPNVKFTMVDWEYDSATANVNAVSFREDQAGFLAGSLAGQVSASGKLGCVGGTNGPPVLRYCNGFVQGVQYVCPSCTVATAYTQDYDAPDEAWALMQPMMQDGADVLFGAGDEGIVQAAQAGAWVVGVDLDEYTTTFLNGQQSGSNRLITSALKELDDAIYLSIQNAVVDSNFQSGNRILTMADGAEDIAPYHDVDGSITTAMRNTVAAVKAGLINNSISTNVDYESGNINQ